MTIQEQIQKEIKTVLKKNNAQLVSEMGGGFNYEDFGGVSFDLNIAIDISHIESFDDALQKLTDCDSSPISNDGYTATDIYQPSGLDLINYIMEYSYIFEEYRETSINFLKENCDEKMVDDIIKKVDHLHMLGFENISMSYSYFMEEQFQKRVEEEINEITAGYYELEDEEVLRIKYKILGIN